MLAFTVTNKNRYAIGALHRTSLCYCAFCGAELQTYVETERDFSYYGGRPSLVLNAILYTVEQYQF